MRWFFSFFLCSTIHQSDYVMQRQRRKAEVLDWICSEHLESESYAIALPQGICLYGISINVQYLLESSHSSESTNWSLESRIKKNSPAKEMKLWIIFLPWAAFSNWQCGFASRIFFLSENLQWHMYDSASQLPYYEATELLPKAHPCPHTIYIPDLVAGPCSWELTHQHQVVWSLADK